jgi:nucleoside-diphosphate-sugar epimerase
MNKDNLTQDFKSEDIKKIAELSLNWERLSNKTILISGGTGFIGSFLSDVIRYRNRNYNSNTKILSLSRRCGISDDTVKFIKADITVPLSLTTPVDYILHLASNTHPKQYGEDPVGTIITNVYGCNNLLTLAREKKARFLLASSVEIYGQGCDTPMDEYYSGPIDCNQARSGYNEAKRTCEALCQSYRQQFDVDIVIARLSRVFGADTKNDTKAMAQFISKAVSGEDIILRSAGNQRFSYCYIADAVSGLLKILLDGKNGEAYNISDDDDGMTLTDYTQLLAKLAGTHVTFDIKEDLAASKATYALLDCTKLKKLGWLPQYTIQDGLERTYNILKSNFVK